jgi:dienelactone hydrolase
MLSAMPRALPAAALAVLLTTGCSASLVRFPNATPARPLAISGWLSTPRGGGPFPAVILLHGCHGVSGSTHDWAAWFRDQGYVALVVDSWTARGMSEGCSPESPDLANTERFDDTVGALRFLHGVAAVDRERVGVIGWSNGGVFALSAVNGPTLERQARRGVTLPAPGFQAAVGVYPGGCPSLARELVVRPILVLIGGADDWTVPGPCQAMVENMRAKGADATIVVYPGAFHYFDVPGQPLVFLPDVVNDNKPGHCCGATVGYDAAAFADARRRVADFFGYHLRRR